MHILQSPQLRRLLLTTFLLITILTLLIYLIYLLRGILLSFILAVILAYLLNPLVKFLERYRFSRVHAIIIIYFIFIITILLLGFYALPLIVRELNTFIHEIPTYTHQIQNLAQNFYHNYRQIAIPESVRQVINESIHKGETILLQTIRQVAQGIISLFSQILNIIIAPVLTFYILKDAEHINKRILALVPPGYRHELLALWREIDHVLTGFIRGHFLVAFIVGLLSTIGLAMIGMHFYLLLGIIVGIADLIPYFGPIIGAAPTIMLALLQSHILAIKALFIILVVHQLEGNIIAPKILADSVGLHPLVIIFALLAGGTLYGIVGLLIAVPLVAILRILINHVYKKLIKIFAQN
jgi:sporulation integral membrane protein YtvI